jgi:hypothetical protein
MSNLLQSSNYNYQLPSQRMAPQAPIKNTVSQSSSFNNRNQGSLSQTSNIGNSGSALSGYVPNQNYSLADYNQALDTYSPSNLRSGNGFFGPTVSDLANKPQPGSKLVQTDPNNFIKMAMDARYGSGNWGPGFKDPTNLVSQVQNYGQPNLGGAVWSQSNGGPPAIGSRTNQLASYLRDPGSIIQQGFSGPGFLNNQEGPTALSAFNQQFNPNIGILSAVAQSRDAYANVNNTYTSTAANPASFWNKYNTDGASTAPITQYAYNPRNYYNKLISNNNNSEKSRNDQ